MPSSLLRLCLALLLACALIAAPHPASGLTYANIEGKWCSSSGIITFTRDEMVVTFYDRTPMRNYPIEKYEYRDKSAVVHWTRNDEAQTTEYADFAADGRTMAQLPQTTGDKGPRRPFRRC